jgi:hypothetical protein
LQTAGAAQSGFLKEAENFKAAIGLNLAAGVERSALTIMDLFVEPQPIHRVTDGALP